jgi:hypothetical protein
MLGCKLSLVAKLAKNPRGWTQIVSGLDIIVWSRLASWDESRLQLKPASDEPAFDAYWKTINERSGRWLCWIAFCVGAESFIKGAFGLHGYHVQSFGASHPWKQMKMADAQIPLVSDAILRLAADVRNRDAHEYVHGVRSANFSSLESDFVPALNHVLGCLSKTDLGSKYPGPDPKAF